MLQVLMFSRDVYCTRIAIHSVTNCIWFLGCLLSASSSSTFSIPSQLHVCRPVSGTTGNTKLLLQPPYPNQFLFSAPLPWKQLLLCHCRCHWSKPWFRGVENSVWWFPLQLALSNVWQFNTTVALPGMLIKKVHATAYLQPKQMDLCRVLLPQI